MRSSPGSWRSGPRVAHEQIRTEARQRELARTHLERQNPQPEPGPDLALEQRVGELPEPYREIVLLRYYGGLTCAQVAEHLGMPLGTVTKYLSRSYEVLRVLLRREMDAEVQP